MAKFYKTKSAITKTCREIDEKCQRKKKKSKINKKEANPNKRCQIVNKKRESVKPCAFDLLFSFLGFGELGEWRLTLLFILHSHLDLCFIYFNYVLLLNMTIKLLIIIKNLCIKCILA